MVTACSIMSRKVVSTRPSCKIEEVTRVLYFHGISGLPVIDEAQRVVGMVTEADVLGRITGQESVEDIMSCPAFTIAEETPLEEIAALLTDKKVKRLPVVKDDKLVGIVSRADVVRALAGKR